MFFRLQQDDSKSLTAATPESAIRPDRPSSLTWTGRAASPLLRRALATLRRFK